MLHEWRRRGMHIGYWEEKRSLGRPRYRWLDNIKIDLGEKGWYGLDGVVWIEIGISEELL
jgi:hypothetical protein